MYLPSVIVVCGLISAVMSTPSRSASAQVTALPEWAVARSSPDTGVRSGAAFATKAKPPRLKPAMMLAAAAILAAVLRGRPTVGSPQVRGYPKFVGGVCTSHKSDDP